ncbi:MAG TPA: DotU family type IV/VI secretion system protein [Bryobacteraceae bacterium]|nr:DotU family type IV/VI secretion system protein [Bryobacteraceae bacterium]
MGTRVENLAMLYQGALTAAVRIQSQRQQIGNAAAFRRRMKDVLAEIDREAVKRGYTAAHSREGNFAFAAFLDEVILNSQDACREDWAKKPLQEDLFGISTAGEQFFTHIDGLFSQADTPELIDVMEVFLLCLLLGYQGKHISGGHAELALITDRLRHRVERSRGVPAELSPAGMLPSQPVSIKAVDTTVRTLKRISFLAIGLTVLCFVVLNIHLLLKAETIQAALLRSIVP